MRNSKAQKKHKLRTALSWVDTLEKNGSAGRLAVKRFEERTGASMQAVLETMTGDQLALVFSLASGVYGNASDSQREHWVPKYRAARELYSMAASISIGEALERIDGYAKATTVEESRMGQFGEVERA